MAQDFSEDGANIKPPMRTRSFTLSATPDNATLVTAPKWCGRISWRAEDGAGAFVASKYSSEGGDDAAIDSGHQRVRINAIHSINTNESGSRQNAPFQIRIASATASAVVRMTFELGTS